MQRCILLSTKDAISRAYTTDEGQCLTVFDDVDTAYAYPQRASLHTSFRIETFAGASRYFEWLTRLRVDYPDVKYVEINPFPGGHRRRLDVMVEVQQVHTEIMRRLVGGYGGDFLESDDEADWPDGY